MTWKDLKIITLQKVFAISDGNLVEDDTTREYLSAMPGAANEGLKLLATAGRFLKKQLVIIQGDDAEEGAVVRALSENAVERYDLEDLAEDFYGLDGDGAYFEQDGSYGQASNWTMEAGHVLVLPGNQEGKWTLWYNAYPADITDETADDTELPLHPEAAVLLPLYMASQLYKDDELSMAVQYRNEFEVGRDALAGAKGRSQGSRDAWGSATGWW